MSIYPVRLASWFPRCIDKKKVSGADHDQHVWAKYLVKIARCIRCDRRCKWLRAWGHHSLPWGAGDVWCSKKCLEE